MASSSWSIPQNENKVKGILLAKLEKHHSVCLANTHEPMHEAQPTGTIIQNRYHLRHVLGRGGSGITYEAEDASTGHHVALKELSLKGLSDWKKLELFEREGQVLADLDHPAIPKYVDYFQIDTADNRFFYIAQTLAEGKSLADLVAAKERFTEAEARRIGLEVLLVLQYLHGLNPPIIHRDIKPQNIIRRSDGQICLVDFGAVQTVYRETVAFGSTVVGTYGYMPPEQFRGQAYPTTDLYGLGATLLHLLTHRDPAELPQRRLKYDFRSHTNVSEEFARWLDGLLEPLAEDRFDSAETAQAALTNPRPESYQSSNQTSQPQTLRHANPLKTEVEITRDQQHLTIKIPWCDEQDFIKIVGAIAALGGNIVSSLVFLYAVLIAGFAGFVFSLFLLVPSICVTMAVFRAPAGKIVTELEMKGDYFTFIGPHYQKQTVSVHVKDIKRLEHTSLPSNSYHSAEAFTSTKKMQVARYYCKKEKIQVYLKDIKSVELSALDPHLTYSAEAITISGKHQTYQFGAHLQVAEKQWIVAEIQAYLQERKQLSHQDLEAL